MPNNGKLDKAFSAILADSKIYLAKGKTVPGAVMDSIIDILLSSPLLRFWESTKPAGDGYMKLIPRWSYAEGTYLLRPVGKSLGVSVANINMRQSIEYFPSDLPVYSYIYLSRGAIQGVTGEFIEKEKVYHQHYPAGFTSCGVGVLFLPEFFDTLLHSRHGISPDEITQAIDALNTVPLIPDAAVILKQMGEASFTGDIGNIWIEAKALELVSVVLDWHRRLGTRELPQLTVHDQTGISEALRYIEKHFAEPVSLAILAKQAAMSISKFTTVFRRHTGFSAGTYINRLRMEKAMDMLKNTQASIVEITDMVGYKYPANFCTAFLEKFGVTPGEFRKHDNKGKLKTTDD
jgi:AraC-like DNA-binding protein